jgi:hypothetical protein
MYWKCLRDDRKNFDHLRAIHLLHPFGRQLRLAKMVLRKKLDEIDSLPHEENLTKGLSLLRYASLVRALRA